MGAERRHISLGWGFVDLIASLPCFDCRKFDRSPWWFIVSFIKNANIWLLGCSLRFLIPQQSCNSWGLRFTRCSVSAKQGCQQSAAFTDGCKTRKSSCRRDVPAHLPWERSLCVSSLSVYSTCDNHLHPPSWLLAELWVNVYTQRADWPTVEARQPRAVQIPELNIHSSNHKYRHGWRNKGREVYHKK